MIFSELGLGCYSLSGVYGKKDSKDFVNVMRYAYEQGITYFDTADSYGDEGEEILAKAVNPFRNNVIIATKVGIQDGEQPQLSERYLIQACEKSLKRIRTDYIDLYQIHFNDPNTPVAETVLAFDKLISQGKIRNYGISHLPSSQIREYQSHGKVFSVFFELSAVACEVREEILPFC
jgi:aryl-alcohol dehydrogenase-like predicted oxidoreductase